MILQRIIPSLVPGLKQGLGKYYSKLNESLKLFTGSKPRTTPSISTLPPPSTLMSTLSSTPFNVKENVTDAVSTSSVSPQPTLGGHTLAAFSLPLSKGTLWLQQCAQSRSGQARSARMLAPSRTALKQQGPEVGGEIPSFLTSQWDNLEPYSRRSVRRPSV